MGPYFQRPENALKRSEELVAVGQQPAALELLHEVVSSKRSRSVPLAILEPLMLRLLDLSVDLKKPKMAREALHQYKNAQQNTSIPTIERVVKHYISLASSRLAEAQSEADERVAQEVVEDLEESSTPEALLLATVSTEQSKDRTDRSLVTPWLRLQWEAFRAVLDILRNNARLESLYQSMTQAAFAFCKQYARKLEFRRLCDLLRSHLTAATKYAHQAHAIDLSDPDTLQRHLDTRSAQLNVAVDLDLWQEAFRTVEDIHHLLALAKRAPRPHMMRNYYGKLARIFLVSDNLLFHAAARLRHHQLWKIESSRSGETPDPEVVSAMASGVILSILAIPLESTAPLSAASSASQEVRSSRLTHLLGLSNPPTRSSLLQEAITRGLLAHIPPSTKAIYDAIEVRFHPLSICTSIAPLLAEVTANDTSAAETVEDATPGSGSGSIALALATSSTLTQDEPGHGTERYVAALRRVVLTRLLQQLSQVYTTLKIDRLSALVAPLQAFPATASGAANAGLLERAILQSCRRGELGIQIDHAAGVLRFGSAGTATDDLFSVAPRSASAASSSSSAKSPSARLHSHLARLNGDLTKALAPPAPSPVALSALAVSDALKDAAEWVRKENLLRRALIDRRKRVAEATLAAKEKADAEARSARAAVDAAAAIAAAEERARTRELNRINSERAAIERAEAQKLAEAMHLGSGAAGEAIESTDALMALQMKRLEKERVETAARLKSAGKRLDHLERAFRREEIPLLEADAVRQAEIDAAAWKAAADLAHSTALERHTREQDASKRLGRLRSIANRYAASVTEAREVVWNKTVDDADAAIEAAVNARYDAYHALVEQVRLEREAEERRVQEELEKEQARLAAEAAAAEAAEAAEAAKKAEEAERLRKLDEQAARQRERERIAEEKIAGRIPSGGRPSTSGAYTPPRAVSSGRPGAYVPRHLRPAGESSPSGSPKPSAATLDTPSPKSTEETANPTDEAKPTAWRPKTRR